jgi:hypothetical protein
MARTFESWASSQTRKPTDKISNLDKLKAPFVISEYETWGEVYAAAGIEPPKEKAKASNTKKEVQGKIKTLEDSIATAEKVINDPTNPNKEFARTQLEKFKAELEPLKQTEKNILGKEKATREKEKATREKELQQSEEITKEGAREAQIRLTGREKGAKPMPPGTFTPVKSPAFTPAAKVTVTEPTATPAAKTPGTPGPAAEKPPPKKKAETPPKPGETKTTNIDEIFALVQNQYGPVDAIFKENPQLRQLMIDATKGTASTKDDYTPQRFLNELKTTDWWAENSEPIRNRQFYKKEYENLLKKGGNAEELAKTTEYGRGLANAKQVIADAAVSYGSSVNPTELDMLATQIYDLANEGNGAIVGSAIRAKIKYTPGAALGGAAGVSLAELQRTASANGLDLNKQFGSSLQGWLQKIAQGESPETYKQIIRDTAKIGLPDRVASLIDKGVDLETIYNPYRNMMAATLEVNPETIKLNDPTLRMAIGPDKEMSLYDYQRSLRKDARWQYTDNARQEVSSIAKSVLKDFGFQG